MGTELGTSNPSPRGGGSAFADLPPDYHAVVVKALLVHSACWNSKIDLLKEICGPADKRRHVERAENAARFLGYGIPDIPTVLECSENRAALVGYGALEPDHAHNYRIPLPASLERVTDPRELTITLAWFSPVRAGHQSYRSVRLEAGPHEPQIALGVKRFGAQPSDVSARKGTVFHERFVGASAVPFVDDGHLSLRVFCKEDAGPAPAAVRYGLAVTIKAGTALPVYEEIRQRLRVRPQPPA